MQHLGARADVDKRRILLTSSIRTRRLFPFCGGSSARSCAPSSARPVLRRWHFSKAAAAAALLVGLSFSCHFSAISRPAGTNQSPGDQTYSIATMRSTFLTWIRISRNVGFDGEKDTYPINPGIGPAACKADKPRKPQGIFKQNSHPSFSR